MELGPRPSPCGDSGGLTRELKGPTRASSGASWPAEEVRRGWLWGGGGSLSLLEWESARGHAAGDRKPGGESQRALVSPRHARLRADGGTTA